MSRPIDLVIIIDVLGPIIRAYIYDYYQDGHICWRISKFYCQISFITSLKDLLYIIFSFNFDIFSSLR